MKVLADLSLFLSYLESGQLILTPGKRLARQITSSWLSQREGSVARPPAVQTVDAWLEQQWRDAVEAGRLPTAQLLSPVQEQALWQQTVRQDIDRRGDFSLSHPKSAALRAQSAWHKLLMHGGGQIDNILGLFEYDEDCSVFAAWARAFLAELEVRQAVTRYQAYQQLLDLAPDRKPSIALYGVPTLPPLTESVLEHLCSVIRLQPWPAANQPDDVIEFATRDEELWAAAQWAKKQIESGLERVGIVLLDMATDRQPLEYHLREVFDCLDARYNDLPVNFSTGIPLVSAPSYRDLLLALEWEIRALTSHEWLSLLRSPYINAISRGHNALALISSQLRIGDPSVSLERALHLCARLSPEMALTKTLRTIRSDRATVGVKSLDEWAEVIRGRIGVWGWPQRSALDSLEYQQIGDLEDSFDALAALSSVLPHQHYSRALQYWRDCLAAMMFQPKTPQDSIQVLGPLEALGGQFDALWLCGAQQNVLPARRRLEPFIPALVQKKLRFVDIDEAQLLAEAEDMFSTWRSSSDMLIASYHAWEQDLPQYPSPLVPPPTERVPQNVQLPRSWTTDVMLEPLPAESLVPIASDAQSGGASLIKDQAACPFRAFVLHRLRPNEIADPLIGLSPAERGALFHDALFRFWGKIRSQAELIALDEQALQLQIESAITDALDALESGSEARGFSLRERVGIACWDLEKQVVLRVMTEWMALEKSRSEPFVVDQLEAGQSLSLGGVTLSLRPDRIDRMDAGGRLIIDYKSRAPAKTHWLGEKPQEPQLPLYTLLDDDIEGIAFGEFSVTGPVRFVSLGERYAIASRDVQRLSAQTGGLVDDWPDLVRYWRRVLDRLATDFANGKADIDPTPSACSYCSLSSVCRVHHVQYARDPDEETVAW